MSFLINKPTASTEPVRTVGNRRAAAVPVFKPEFARSVRMRPRLAAAVAFCVTFAILMYALHLQPVYEAESIVRIEPSAVKPLATDTAAGFDPTRYDTFVQEQLLIAQRLDILSEAIRMLPRGTWQQPGETVEAAAGRLQNSLKIARLSTSYQLSFTLRGADPGKLADTLNAVVTTYLSAGRKEELSQSDQRAQILSEERTRITNELTADRTEQTQLSAALGMANPGLDAGNAYDEQLTALRSQLATAREQHDLAAAQLASVSGSDASRAGLAAAAEEVSGSDAGLASLKSAIASRRAVLVSQMSGMTSENPIFKQDQEEIGDLDRQLDTMSLQVRDKAARRVQDKLRTDLTRTGDVEARLNAELAREIYAATSATPKLQRATELNADVRRLMTRYATVDDSLRALQLDASGPGLAHLTLAATPPLAPLASRKHLLLAAALPLGLLVGIFAAVFARKRDHHLYTGNDIQSTLGFGPIAVLPASSDVSADSTTEYMLRFAGGIEGAYRSGDARSFVLTAAGASTNIEQLTGSLRERLAQLGLGSVAVTAQEVLSQRLADPRETKLPAEPWDQLFDSHDTGRSEGYAVRNLEDLKKDHDIVLISSPPILTSAETEYVARIADATILIVESGVTNRSELLQAATLLERLRVNGVGAVLDNLTLRNADPAFLRAVASVERRRAAQPHTMRAMRSEQAAVKQSEEQPVETSGNVVLPDHDGLIPDRPHDDRSAPAFQPRDFDVPSENVEKVIRPDSHSSSLPVLVLSTEDAEPAQSFPECIASEKESSLPEADVAITPLSHPMPQPSSTKESSLDEPKRGWLSRLFQGESDDVVSIIPTDDDDGDERVDSNSSGLLTNSAQPGSMDDGLIPAMHLEAAPLQRNALRHMEAEFDLPLRDEVSSASGGQAVMSDREPVSMQILEDAPARHPTPEIRELPLPEPSYASWEDSESSVVLSTVGEAPSVAKTRLPAEPFVQLSEEAEAAPAQTASQSAPISLSPPIPDTSSLQSDTVRLWSLSPQPLAVAEQAGSVSPTPRRPSAQPVLPDVLPAQPERTARLEPEPAKRNSGPWRDRRVAGSDTHIHPSQDRRFNWAARAAERSLSTNAPAGAVEAVPTNARPHLVPKEHHLTRNWGLLSRFEQNGDQPNSPAHRDASQPESPDGGTAATGEREFRRG